MPGCEKKVSRIYLSASADLEITDMLSMYSGVVPTLLPPFSRLSAPVASHPDMLMLSVDGHLFSYGEYLEEQPQLRPECAGAEPVGLWEGSERGSVRSGSTAYEPADSSILSAAGSGMGGTEDKAPLRYPFDISLNALPLDTERGHFLLCRSDVLSPEVRRAAESAGREVVNVRQGYTHCSVCTVADGRLITADRGIAEIAEGLGASVLLISPGGIDLEPYNTGFIGGASVRMGSRIIFFGELKKHPDGDRILGFCREAAEDGAPMCGIPLCEIVHAMGRLRDYGSAVVIY